MALAVDSTNATGTSATGSTGINFSFTNTAGDLLVACSGLGDNSFATATSTFTYAAVAVATAVGDVNGSAWVRCAAKAKIAPATGANSVAVAIGGGVNCDQLALGAISFSGADQTTPIGNTGTGSSTGNPATAGFTVATGNIALCGVASDDASLAVSGTTERWKILGVGSDTDYGMATKAGSGASETMPWTVSGSEPFAEWGAEIKAAAGGAAVVKTVDGITLATMKTRDGVVAASVKTIDGLASV